jgi:lysophospholipase L1-like esterase
MAYMRDADGVRLDGLAIDSELKAGRFRGSAAIRNMALPAAALSGPPTIAASVAASGTPPGGYQAWAMATVDSRLRRSGMPAVVADAGSGAYAARSQVNNIGQGISPSPIEWAFSFYGRRLAIRYFANGALWRPWVNGVPYALTHILFDASGNTSRYIILDFTTTATRDIVIEGELGFALSGVAVESDGSLGPPSSRGKGKLLVLGDSISFGYTSTGAVLDSTFFFGYFRNMGRLLGLSDVSLAGAAPGTGFLGSTGTYPVYGARIAADVIAEAPDAVLMTATPNDYVAFSAIGGPAAYDTAVRAVIAALRAGLPNALLVCAGSMNAPYNAAYDAMNAAFAGIASDVSVPYISTNGWMTSSAFVGDGTHPTALGGQRQARNMASQLGPILGIAA